MARVEGTCALNLEACEETAQRFAERMKLIFELRARGHARWWPS
jgi:hypothetical protein